MKALRASLPWLVAVGIIWALVLRVDAAATLRALEGAALERYLPLAVAFVALWLVLDAAILGWLFARIGARLGFPAMLVLRASTYPAMTISFHLASVQLVALVHRNTGTGTSLSRISGALLVHYLADACAIASLALGASLLVPAERIDVLRPLLAWTALGLAIALAGGRLLLGRSVGGRGKPLIEVLAMLRGPDLLILVALRALFYASFALFVWLSAPSFELHPPLLDVLARMPLVQWLAALPVAPAGIGSTQAAMLWLFGGFGAEPDVLAYAVAYGSTLILLRLPLGVVAWAARCWKAAPGPAAGVSPLEETTS